MPQQLVVVVFGRGQCDPLAFCRSAKKENRTAFEPSTDCVLCRRTKCSEQRMVSIPVLHVCPWPFGACERAPDTASACFEPSSFTTLRSSFPFHLIFSCGVGASTQTWTASRTARLPHVFLDVPLRFSGLVYSSVDGRAPKLSASFLVTHKPFFYNLCGRRFV